MAASALAPDSSNIDVRRVLAQPKPASLSSGVACSRVKSGAVFRGRTVVVDSSAVARVALWENLTDPRTVNEGTLPCSCLSGRSLTRRRVARVGGPSLLIRVTGWMRERHSPPPPPQPPEFQPDSALWLWTPPQKERRAGSAVKEAAAGFLRLVGSESQAALL